jgi:hypothetical protein
MLRRPIPTVSVLLLVLGCGSGPAGPGTGGSDGRGAAGGAGGSVGGAAGEKGGAGGLAGGASGSAGGAGGSVGGASGSAGGVSGSAGGRGGSAGGVAGSAGGAGAALGGAGGGGGTAAAGGSQGGAAGGANLNWAGWPMPNDIYDVGQGAPNPMAYASNGDGTVTDLVTGLMWQQSAPPLTYNWSDAVAYCPRQSIAGHNDWRLPTEIELVSLIDGYPRAPDPAINPDAFPQTPVDFFWSSTPLAGAPGVAWFVLFQDGTVSATDGKYASHVRCVRSPGAAAGPTAPPARYVVGAATVQDSQTNLVWQRSLSAAMYGWQDARAYCPGADVASALGGTGWRLPSKKELLTLVDFGVPLPGPTLDVTAFPGATAVSLWSVSAVNTSFSTAWRVAFDSGGATTLDVGSPLHVRCVR